MRLAEWELLLKFVGLTLRIITMSIYIRKSLSQLLSCFLTVFVVSCSSWMNPESVLDIEPSVFPDYKDVTIPYNIAPMNFMVEGADRIQAVVYIDGQEKLTAAGKEGVIRFPLKKWRAMLDQNRGSRLDVQVSVWSEEFPQGVAYRPFVMNVAKDEIDPWISYRLIEPGYIGWRQVGIYQRELSSFDESEIVTNRESNTTCINCHNYPSYSPESMMFHARGSNGGTVLYHDGKLKKIDFKNIGPKKSTTYPAWHPEGRYIAFSSNSTYQFFYGEGETPIEVYDTASDLVLYDVLTGEVLSDPRFITEESLETFPSWSPDGQYLYYVAAQQRKLPDEIKEMHYSIHRVPFNVETGKFGDAVELVYDADTQGGSASYPHISADGSYLLYTWSQYGTFPVWHKEADLRMIDLESMDPVDISLWNDEAEADSYHSWSSNGRWIVFGSRRIDGRYTRLYISYFDEDGSPYKPFLLPQENPLYNEWRMKSFNVPEFTLGKVTLPKEAAELFL